MKSIWIVILASVAAATLYAQTVEKTSETESRLAQNIFPSSSVPNSSPVRGEGLSPTTWALATKATGTVYGTTYILAQTDLGSITNTLVAYSLSYPFITNDLRAIYTFDVSSLAGLPGPIWSSFMFDTRERPTAGTRGLFRCRAVSLVSDGETHSIEGLQFNSGNNAMHLDLYDAEEFENPDPFAHPELAYSEFNPLLTTIPVVDGTEIEFSIDVTEAVNLDLAPTVPTLGEVGRAALLLLLGLGGLYIIRQR